MPATLTQMLLGALGGRRGKEDTALEQPLENAELRGAVGPGWGWGRAWPGVRGDLISQGHWGHFCDLFSFPSVTEAQRHEMPNAVNLVSFHYIFC